MPQRDEYEFSSYARQYDFCGSLERLWGVLKTKRTTNKIKETAVRFGSSFIFVLVFNFLPSKDLLLSPIVKTTVASAWDLMQSFIFRIR